MLYLYILSIKTRHAIQTATILKHCALAAVVFCAQIPILFLLPASALTESFQTWFANLALISFYIQLALYLFASFALIQAHTTNLYDTHSAIEALTLSWLKKLLGIFTIVMIVDVSVTLPAVMRGEDIPFLQLLVFVEALAIFAIGYFSLRYSAGLPPNALTSDATKYAGSPIDDPLSQSLADDLAKTMHIECPHLQNDLTLAQLADISGLSPHHLSQVINSRFGTNFYGFINQYRVDAACDLLLQAPTKSITEIAFEVGFNNRVSFNNAFRKATGLTPSRFRKTSAPTLHLELDQRAQDFAPINQARP